MPFENDSGFYSITQNLLKKKYRISRFNVNRMKKSRIFVPEKGKFFKFLKKIKISRVPTSGADPTRDHNILPIFNRISSGETSPTLS